MVDILVLHGPNLNLLGKREPGFYGHTTLEKINNNLAEKARSAGISIDTQQSNHEGELVDLIHRAGADQVDFIIINPAAYTHTSVAMRDALSAVAIPFIEVHLSNVHSREAFRRHSYFSDIATGVISGLGAQAYDLALTAALSHLSHQNDESSLDL